MIAGEASTAHGGMARFLVGDRTGILDPALFF